MDGPESDRERWNRKYRDEGPESYGSGPTEWLAAVLEDALVPGGLLIFETFTRGQIGLPRGPSTAEHARAGRAAPGVS